MVSADRFAVPHDPAQTCSLSASIMRQAVYGTARLGLHREFSDHLKKSQGGGDISALQSAGSAMAAGAIASVIGTPFDVSLVRMQADGMRPKAEQRGYKNVFDAIGRISREEGVTKLWRGFEPTAFRAIAMNVGMMASYDQAKQSIRKMNGDNMVTNMAASAISGFCASFTSLPFDMMKVRTSLFAWLYSHPAPVLGAPGRLHRATDGQRTMAIRGSSPRLHCSPSQPFSADPPAKHEA